MSDLQPLANDLDRRIDAWLQDGPELAPRAFVEATLRPIPAMAQRRWSLAGMAGRAAAVPALGRVAAVVAVAVVGVALAFANNGFGPGSRPTPTPPRSSSSPAASSGPTASPYVLPSSVPDATAQTVTFGQTASVAVPAGWFGTGSSLEYGPEDHPGGLVLLRRDPVLGTECPETRSTRPTLGPVMTATEMAAAILADPRLTVVSQPAITIDGREAQVLDVALAPTFTGTCGGSAPSALLFDEPGSFVVVDAGRRIRVILLDLDGTPFLIGIFPVEEAGDAFVARAMPVIESITFLP